MNEDRSAADRAMLVVGFDGSVDSAAALWHARLLAEERDGDLVVVFVHRIPAWEALAMASGAGALPIALTDNETRARERATLLLADFMGNWIWQGREGDVARQLAEVAIQHDADLVVIGGGHRGKGHRGVAARLLQSTTRSVLVCGFR